MAEITIADDNTLTVHIEGIDSLLAMRQTITIPRQHISRVDHDPEAASGLFGHGIRILGTSIPGVVRAGTFASGGTWSFWDVHDPQQAVVLTLHDERYGQILVGVRDPEGTVGAVRRWMSGFPGDGVQGAAPTPSSAPSVS